MRSNSHLKFTRMLSFSLFALASCATGQSVCEQAVEHARECGLDVASPQTCGAEAAAAAEEILELECPGPRDAKSDGSSDFSDWDDFQCSIRTEHNGGLLEDVFSLDNCACWRASGFRAPRDYDDNEGVLSGRVLDTTTQQPVQLEPGQWLAVKTAAINYGVDTQVAGIRTDAQGNFVISGLMCELTDLRVYIEDATTVPKRRSDADWTAENRYPLAVRLEGATALGGIPSLFTLSAARPPISVLVTPGTLRTR